MDVPIENISEITCGGIIAKDNLYRIGQNIGIKDIIITVPHIFEKELIVIWNDSDTNLIITIPPKGKLIVRKEDDSTS